MLSLLPTKLHCPPLPPQPVPRPQLLARLDEGLARGHNLTLVIAPAGFGKTTTVSLWLAGSNHAAGRQAAWLSLDEYDNDPALFVGYVAAAVQRVFPDACPNTASLVQAPQLPPVPQLAALLLQELAALEEPCVLVLEDYHAIMDATIHQLMSRLIENLPPPVHLVLTGRMEPPLPLPRLRVRQRLTELRAADLCFSDAESHALLAQTLGAPPAPATVTALQTLTEGWAAGLQLAALSLRGRADVTTFVRTFQHSSRLEMDFLLEEVLARQPVAVQTFLVRTSILERFCAPLCAAVLGEGGAEQSEPAAAALQDYLIQHHLFVVPLDEEGTWFRFHHLFGELLRHQLQTRAGAAEIATLHRRASAWLAAQGLIDEALQQALAAGYAPAAAQLVEQHRHDALNREAWRTLDRWLALLPEELVRQRPALLLAQAWVLALQFKLAATVPLLQAAESWSAGSGARAVPAEAEARTVDGEINALRAHIWAWQHDHRRSLAAAQQALDQLPAGCLFVRSVALHALGSVYQLLGQPELGVQTLHAQLEGQLAGPTTLAARLLITLATIYYRRGALSEAQEHAQALWQMARQAKLTLTLSLGWGHYYLGLIHYERNELEAAAQHFAAIVDLRYSLHMLSVHNGWLGLALTCQAQGRFEQARQQVAALLAFHQEMNNLHLLPEIRSFQARLALQQGDRNTALHWAQQTGTGSTPGSTPGPTDNLALDFMLIRVELTWLTRAKILASQAANLPDPAGLARLAEASLLLERLRQAAETECCSLRLVEILALQALVAAGQGHSAQAETVLLQAVALAQPGHFLRTFVDLGPPLAALLYQLATRGVETAYLGQVLAAFPASDDTAYPAQYVRRAAQAHLIEPLTERESEVLLRLHAGLPNKAIAAALNISPLTVKRHTTNIYQKLGVATRQQAIARATALGLIPTGRA